MQAVKIEAKHPIFWFIFQRTIGRLLGWWIEKKTKQLIQKETSRESTNEELAEYRKNFESDKKHISAVFQLRTLFFNAQSAIMRHFCANVANAPALDDVYNALGSFEWHGQKIYPEGAKTDCFSTFYFNCPNGQAVRNRYRQVADLCKTIITAKQGGKVLSIACGSAQPLIHAFYNLKQREIKAELVLTDSSQDALDFAKRRAEQAEIGEMVSYIKSPFVNLNRKFKEEKFDVVEACGILDYLNDRQALFLLKIALNLLKKDGILVASNMNEVPTEANMLRQMYNWHIIYRTPKELNRLIKEAGGKDIKVYIEPWKIHSVATATK